MPITHDQHARRFELELDGETAYVDYRPLADQVVEYRYVYVPPAHRGTGSAGRLLKFAFDHARQQGWTIRPTCSYIAGRFLPRFPEYHDLVEDR